MEAKKLATMRFIGNVFIIWFSSSISDTLFDYPLRCEGQPELSSIWVYRWGRKFAFSAKRVTNGSPFISLP